MRRRLFIELAVFMVLAIAVACAPAQRAELRDKGIPAVEAGCVLIRAIVDDGTTRQVCATIEDLAPLFGELLAKHEEENAPTSVHVAAALPAPKRRTPLRRCAQWVSVVQSSDAGREASVVSEVDAASDASRRSMGDAGGP